MESKRKTRKVRKVVKAIPAPQKSEPPPKSQSAESLIVSNGLLVQELYESKVWQIIINPLISESIASVSGRETNGRYYHGTFTKFYESNGKEGYLSGYQCALMDFHNRLNDFVVEKRKLLEKKKQSELEKSAPLMNPFMEEESDE